MKTITVPIYSFSELSPDARKRAIEGHAKLIRETYDDTSDLDIVKDDLARAGYPDAEIAYSGFCSQGDGLSFEATVDLSKVKVPKELAPAKAALTRAGMSLEIVRGGAFAHRYCHEYTMRCELPDADDEIYAQTEALRAHVLEDARVQAKKAYRFLEECYMDADSEENVTASIEANGYDFHADGTLAASTVRRAI